VTMANKAATITNLNFMNASGLDPCQTGTRTSVFNLKTDICRFTLTEAETRRNY